MPKTKKKKETKRVFQFEDDVSGYAESIEDLQPHDVFITKRHVFVFVGCLVGVAIVGSLAYTWFAHYFRQRHMRKIAQYASEAAMVIAPVFEGITIAKQNREAAQHTQLNYSNSGGANENPVINDILKGDG